MDGARRMSDAGMIHPATMSDIVAFHMIWSELLVG